MPLFKFQTQGSVIETFSGDLVAFFPDIYTEFERLGYIFDAELSPPIPRIYSDFGFQCNLVAPFPAIYGKMQDEFSANLISRFASVDAEFVTINEFYAFLNAPIPEIKSINAFYANLMAFNPVVIGILKTVDTGNFAVVAAMPSVSGMFTREEVVAANIVAMVPVVAANFGVAEMEFLFNESGLLPVINGTFSVPSQKTYGSETDSVLRYNSGRRYI